MVNISFRAHHSFVPDTKVVDSRSLVGDLDELFFNRYEELFPCLIECRYISFYFSLYIAYELIVPASAGDTTTAVSGATWYNSEDNCVKA